MKLTIKGLRHSSKLEASLSRAVNFCFFGKAWLKLFKGLGLGFSEGLGPRAEGLGLGLPSSIQLEALKGGNM